MAHGDDPFEALGDEFGGAMGRLFGAEGSSPRSSCDVSTSVRISFADAVDGCSREVEIDRWLACGDCNGTGAPESAEWEPCPACSGGGKTTRSDGAFELRATCEACRGRGRTTDETCSPCAGVGGATRTDTVSVQIPGGVVDGHELRLAGKGSDLGDGEGPGDHHLVIKVGPHARLTRRGDDLVTTLTLEPTLAEEGGETSVPIPRGQITVQIRPGTQTGDVAELPGHGAQRLGKPATPRPTGPLEPFRAPDPTAHRGNLVVIFVRRGDPLPEASHRAALEVTDEAGPDEIKAAYRRLALAHHPDRNPGDPAAERRFDDASEAYAALTKTASSSSAGDEGMAGQLPLGVAVAVAIVIMVVMYVILTR